MGGFFVPQDASCQHFVGMIYYRRYMETITLEAKTRTELGRQAKQVRAKGFIPAVVYGAGIAATPISVEARAFQKVFARAGESTLLHLEIPGQGPLNVLVQDLAFHAVTNAVEHVDFRAVSLTQKITAEAQLVFVGSSPAVKELGGILVKQHTNIRITGLPQDLVREIHVDLGLLKTFEDALRIKNIVMPSGIVAELDGEDIVAQVEPPRSEEELKSIEGKVEEKVEEVKVATEEKKKERDAAKEKKEEKPHA